MVLPYTMVPMTIQVPHDHLVVGFLVIRKHEVLSEGYSVSEVGCVVEDKIRGLHVALIDELKEKIGLDDPKFQADMKQLSYDAYWGEHQKEARHASERR